MSRTETHIPTQRTAGFLDADHDRRSLKPWALLERLRPVKIERLTTYLRDYDRLGTVFQRLEQCFPGVIAAYKDVS